MTESRLSGWRVLIGRPAGRSTGLIRLLAAEGALCQAVPLIEIVPPEDSAELDAAVMMLAAGECEWVAFTSVNAVAAVTGRAAALDLRPVVPAGTRVAAVGPATYRALRAADVAVDLVPDAAGSGSTLAAVFPTAKDDETVLLPRVDIAADLLPNALRDKGYRVLSAVAYRTVGRPLPASVTEDLSAGRYEAVIITSPSGVPALAAAQPAAKVAIVAIGVPTARALAAAGLPTGAVATNPTDAGIVDAVIHCAVADRPGGHRPPDAQQRGESSS